MSIKTKARRQLWFFPKPSLLKCFNTAAVFAVTRSCFHIVQRQCHVCFSFLRRAAGSGLPGVRFLSSSLKGSEGQRQRGIAAESVAARNQTTAGPGRRLESRWLHVAPRAGFYWPFSITPVTLDWVCGSVSFSWKGQSRLQGQARLKWITSGMRANRIERYLNANRDRTVRYNMSPTPEVTALISTASEELMWEENLNLH